MRNKRIWFSILLTFFINILCLPLWTECDYSGFVRTLFNKEARLDLLYFGKMTLAEPFQYKVSPTPFFASWSYETDVRRAKLCLRAREQWQGLSLQLKAQRDGEIAVLFRAPEAQDEYGFFNSVLTDWRNVKINGKVIFNEPRASSYKKFLSKRFPVKKGDIVQVEGEFRKHHFSTQDFTWLSSGKVWYIITGNLLVFFLIYRLLSYIRGGVSEEVMLSF